MSPCSKGESGDSHLGSLGGSRVSMVFLLRQFRPPVPLQRAAERPNWQAISPPSAIPDSRICDPGAGPSRIRPKFCWRPWLRTIWSLVSSRHSRGFSCTMRRSIENGSCAKRRSAICKIAWDSSSACHGGSRSASERETKQQPSQRSKQASSEAAWFARTPCAGPRYQRPSVAGYSTTDPTTLGVGISARIGLSMPSATRDLPSLWQDFLSEVDRRLPEPVEVHCLGGFVVTLLYGLTRTTNDVDYIEIRPAGAGKVLQAIAGTTSE